MSITINSSATVTIPLDDLDLMRESMKNAAHMRLLHDDFELAAQSTMRSMREEIEDLRAENERLAEHDQMAVELAFITKRERDEARAEVKALKKTQTVVNNYYDRGGRFQERFTPRGPWLV